MPIRSELIQTLRYSGVQESKQACRRHRLIQAEWPEVRALRDGIRWAETTEESPTGTGSSGPPIGNGTASIGWTRGPDPKQGYTERAEGSIPFARSNCPDHLISRDAWL